MTVASRRISSSSASLIPCAYVIVRMFSTLFGDDSGVKVFERGLRPGKRLLVHERHRAIDLRACVGVDLRARRFDQHFLVHQLAFVNGKRIATPMLFDFLARA